MRLMKKIIIILLAGIFTVGCFGFRTTDSTAHYEKTTRTYTNSYIGLSSEYHNGVKDLVMSDKYLKEVPLPRKYKKSLLKNGFGNGEILYTAKLSRFNVYIVAIRTEFRGDPANLPRLVDLSALPCVDNFNIKWYKSYGGQKVLFYHHSVLKNRKTVFNVFSHYKEWKDNSVISIYFIEDYKDVTTIGPGAKYGTEAKFPESSYFFDSKRTIDDIFQDISHKH